jgi:hypothetical protein
MKTTACVALAALLLAAPGGSSKAEDTQVGRAIVFHEPVVTCRDRSG